MKSLRSKVTSQGRVSIPARIRRKLGLTPGATVEWCERGNEVVIRRASKFSSLDIHGAVFPAIPARRSIKEMDEGIRSRMRRSNAPLTSNSAADGWAGKHEEAGGASAYRVGVVKRTGRRWRKVLVGVFRV